MDYKIIHAFLNDLYYLFIQYYIFGNKCELNYIYKEYKDLCFPEFFNKYDENDKVLDVLVNDKEYCKDLLMFKTMLEINMETKTKKTKKKDEEIEVVIKE